MTVQRTYSVLGRTTPGAWCVPCALPSAVTGAVWGLTDTPGTTPPDGVGPALGHINICTECGEVTRGRPRVDD